MDAFHLDMDDIESAADVRLDELRLEEFTCPSRRRFHPVMDDIFGAADERVDAFGLQEPTWTLN